ncbi:MAG TPA: SurA N-terminal domain-containing protein [Xanthobacteraceae bacterium]|nr:SurA N-terminal domain-containing protein [Xanthobacteraceae bacterium]
MLRGIRRVSENWLGRTVMGVVMTALAGSFAIWGINDIFHGYGNSALAKIGKTEIQVEQFRQAYNNRLETISHDLGHPLPPDQANALGLNRQVLSEIVAQAGIDQQASRMGLGVSTAEISRHITSNPQLQNEHGQFDPQRFQLLLQNMQMTEPAFIASERQTMLRRQLIDSVSGNFNPPQAWLDAINQFQNEERSIKYVALGPAQAGDIPQPTDEQLGKYFDDRKIMFRAPEYRKIDTITVTPPALAQWMQISDDDIKKAYDDQHSRFVTPEKRHIEQIVFPTMADAQAAADRIKSGTSFADIATARGLKPQDIDLGTLSKSAMVDPKVADAAFALKEGEVSAPVATQFGAVLVTALKIEPTVTESLAAASPELRNQIALDRAKRQVQDIHDKIEDDRAGGSTLAEAAQKEKLPVATFDVDRSGRDPQGKPVVTIPHGPEIVGDAFASDVGVDNDPVDVDGGYIWYDVAAITSARDRTLDEVKTEVAQRWRDDQIAARLKSNAADLLSKLKSGNAFDTLAASETLKTETANDLKRGGSSGDVSANMTQAIFHTAKGDFGSSEGADPGKWIVFQVTDVKMPKLDPNSPDAKHIEETLHTQMTDDLIGEYVNWLEQDLGTTVNPSVLAQAMGNGAPDTN